jgi:hypothetical protein
MKLTDALELQTLLAADGNYPDAAVWNIGNGYTVEATRKTDGAKITAKVSDGNLIVEVSNQ